MPEEGRDIVYVLVSLISVAKCTSCINYFSHGVSLHRHVHSVYMYMYTCISHILIAERSYAHAHVSATPRVIERK